MRSITLVAFAIAVLSLGAGQAHADSLTVDESGMETTLDAAAQKLAKAKASLDVLDLRKSEQESFADAIADIDKELGDVALVLDAGVRKGASVTVDDGTWTRETREVAAALAAFEKAIEDAGLPSADATILDRHVTAFAQELDAIVVGGAVIPDDPDAGAVAKVRVRAKRFRKAMKTVRKSIRAAERDVAGLGLKRKAEKRLDRYLSELDGAVVAAVDLVSDARPRGGKATLDLMAWWDAHSLIHHEARELDRLLQRFDARGIDVSTIDDDLSVVLDKTERMFSSYAIDSVDYDAMPAPKLAWETELPDGFVDTTYGDGPIFIDERRSGTPVSTTPTGPVAMESNSFDVLIAAVEDQSFSSDRVSTIATAAGANHFTVAQAVRLVQVMDFESDKKEVAILLYPTVVDPQNWFQINSAFDFSSSSEEVREALGL